MAKLKKLHLKYSFVAFLKLIRLPNLLILALTQYATALFLIGPKEEWAEIIKNSDLLLIILSTFFITAAGYIINDYYDIKIDIINKPKRVVVGKLLTRRIAITCHTIFNFSGILLGLLVSWKIALIDFFAAYFLWLYSNSLKRLPLIGNITISLLTSVAILLIAFYFKRNEQLVVMFAVFAFFISLIREIIKDMEDVKGDAAFGCKTLPLVYGIRKTKVFLYILTGIFLINLFVLGRDLNQQVISYFIIFIFVPILFLITKLIKSDSGKDFRLLSKMCKFIMLSGVVSMIFI
jgi:4-hydroxybenzoate polyprenyltransferase